MNKIDLEETTVYQDFKKLMIKRIQWNTEAEFDWTKRSFESHSQTHLQPRN